MANITVPIWKPVALYTTRVSWTSRFREALDAIAQNDMGKTSLAFFFVVLFPDNDNEHDPNAVAVLTRDRQMLGYLPADTAAVYRRRMSEAGFEHQASACEAVLSGGIVAAERTYDYTLEIDLDMVVDPAPDHLVIHPELHRLDADPPFQPDESGAYRFKVWLPHDAVGNLKRNNAAHGWTTDSWSTVNYYLKNSQGIGLGNKVLTVDKREHAMAFGKEPVNVVVESIERRWVTLRLHA